MTTKAVNTTAGQNSWRAIVSVVVGAAISFVAAHLTGFDTGKFAEIAVFVVPAYFTAISFLEAKFPSLSWLFLLFPQKPATPVAKSKAPKKPVVK